MESIKLIKEMLKSPQGKDIKTEENANGETKGIRNPDRIGEKNQ